MADDILDFLSDLEKKPAAAKPSDAMDITQLAGATGPKPEAKSKVEEGPKEKEDPILLLRVSCPICGAEKIPHQEMKAKTLPYSVDRFWAPIWGESAKYKSVDYNLINVTVCPGCFLASPDRRDFMGRNPVTGKPDKSQLNDAVLKELAQSRAERAEVFKKYGGGPNMFERGRNRKQAILSYYLSIYRATTEIKCKIPRSQFKRGYTWAKVALLERQDGRDGKQALENARKDYDIAFTAWDFPNDDYGYQTIYSIGAIWYYLGNKEEATRYVSLLDKYRMDVEAKAKKDSSVNTGPVRKWVGIARDMWERKDDPGWWDVK